MVNWGSPAEIAHDAACYDRLIHCFFGLYIWEWVVSLHFEWRFISGMKKFRWPMIFYFLNRYCLMAALIGNIIGLNVTKPVNCQVLYTFNLYLGNASIGLASINLTLRTMAIWSHVWYIVGPLFMIILGHWSLLLHGIVWKVTWIPGIGCAIITTETKFLAATFIYSMVFDFIVLVLTGYKLCNPAVVRSKLVVLIFNDGLVYFLIAFLLNVVATIYMLLSLNPIMSIVANLPVAIFSTIVAGRVVRRLNYFSPPGVELSTTQGSVAPHRSGVSSSLVDNRPTSMPYLRSDGVQMETFKSSNEGFVEYDVTEKETTGVNSDPESRVISQEFNRPLYYTST